MNTPSSSPSLSSAGSSAPHQHPQKRGGRTFLGRILGRNKQPRDRGDQAQILRENLSQKLPHTDPLRTARLQTHLFLGQLPSFPRPQDQPLPASGNSDSGDLAPLRADKQRRQSLREAREEQAAQDPARQRMETLRSRRQRELQAASGSSNPSSSLAAPRPKNAALPARPTGPTTSRAAQAAAARTPARLALNQVAAGQRSQIPAGSTTRASSGVGFGLNSLLLLVAIVTVLLVLAAGWWGYNWYQDQGFGGLGSPNIETPSNDLFDDETTAEPAAPAVPTTPQDDLDLNIDIETERR